MYRLDHSRRDLTDMNACGKITSPRAINMSKGVGFSQGLSCQLDPECCGLTDLGHELYSLF